MSATVWVVLGVSVGCCPGCEGGYCQEYAEGTPVISIHATRESALAAACGNGVEEWELRGEVQA